MTLSVNADRPSRAGMYFAFFGGAIAWTLHLIGSYLIAEFACLAGADRAQLYGITLIAWSLLAFSLLMLAVAIIAALVGLRARKRLRDEGEAQSLERPTEDDERHDTETHFARSGIIMSAIFALVIVFQTLPIFFFLGGC